MTKPTVPQSTYSFRLRRDLVARAQEIATAEKVPLSDVVNSMIEIGLLTTVGEPGAYVI